MEIDGERKSVLKAYLQKLKTYQAKEEALEKIKETLKVSKENMGRNEEMLLSLQTIGMSIGEVLKCLSEEKYIVKVSLGPHYVVGCRSCIDKKKITQGTRVALDVSTNTIMKILPREVHPAVYSMTVESPGKVKYEDIGGLRNQMREIREVIELPMTNPELFERVGVKAPKGVLLYGPPGTGKTLLARALASNLECHFLKVVASGIVDKYLGESARLIREMFAYAREHQPCVIFMDEIDAIAGKRIAEGIHSDREIQRTLMELLAQMDGFNEISKVKIIMATNRPDVLDPALMRPGRLDRKIEISLPNDQGRIEILKIHSKKMNIQEEVDYEAMGKLTEGFNGADLRNVCTEAGMFAIRDDRDYCIEEDFFKAIRKQAEAKKLENQFGDIKI
ncbi:26S protease regulatory subunit, putative [Entamoeba histolytica HM-1:IMSS-B]|uniref:26S protease regulatory subunit, putative n=4 Tax=Entamoeba histolytica TaxID=5759 RepID=C4LZW8_ENTH1|nr:26S protease regulatory subunit, putative [Entamoeba histolytica HM-1:IMSS]EAL49331.2 26S protease regulatory subunit, putative [Entamoeba histolytica HM-1:IMSS]EMH72583.1 26S protease regulatory subunit, putative [Entamoeba histolytica HM-1:IMSS-B]ENY61077.1 26S protease regulatory subunit S10B, putative [Entamoeba histolytica HM-1:IMSS-A]GAT94429.1 26S protease regulatory subunit putative [Entamoeba histolytica]|eukprot:XP_654722.2 26S protease regulatory subunit, putative [Entamoeba histolytica HM-1:IMSS]